MSDEELAKAPDTQHIPMVLGSVVMTYNVAGVTAPLKFDGPTKLLFHIVHRPTSLRQHLTKPKVISVIGRAFTDGL